MGKYYKKTGQNLFCQDFLVETALAHTNQFLKKLNDQIDFEQLLHKKLLETYKGKAEIGGPAYRPVILFKMLFLAYLFNVSERDIERTINDSISMKSFLSLALDEAAPDHSSLTRFKDRIIKYKEATDRDILQELFDEIIISAQGKGIELGYTQVIDSTHTIADVNTRKDKKRQKSKEDGGDGKPPRDPDAQWGVKRIKKVKTVDGKMVKVKESYFAYKSHLSINAATNFVTSYKVTPMNRYDGHYFEKLLREDVKKGVVERGKTIYTADKAYDDGENHVWLNQEQLKDAIVLIRAEKTEEDKPKVKWDLYTTQEEFEAGLKQRYTVERVNAGLKKHHGLDRARYLGLEKMHIQTTLTILAHNLKTFVKLLTNVGLKTPTKLHVSLG